MPRIKGSRAVEQILCNFNEEQQTHKEASPKLLNQTMLVSPISDDL